MRADQGGQGGVRHRQRRTDGGSRPRLRQRRLQGSGKRFGKTRNRNHFAK